MMPQKCFTHGHDWKNRLSDERLAELHEVGFETWREAVAQKICRRCDKQEFVYGGPSMPPLFRVVIGVGSLLVVVVFLVGS